MPRYNEKRRVTSLCVYVSVPFQEMPRYNEKRRMTSLRVCVYVCVSVPFQEMPRYNEKRRMTSLYVCVCVCVSVPFQEMPRYNEKRRMTTLSSAYGSLQRSRSNPSLHMLFMHDDVSGSAAPSPLPSTRSANPAYALHHSTVNGYDSDSPRSMSVCSAAGSVSGER